MSSLSLALPISLRGALFRLPASLFVSAPRRKPSPPDLDSAFTIAAAEKPDASRLVREHHEAIFDRASRGWLRDAAHRKARLLDLIASAHEHCSRLATALADLDPAIVVVGGNQPRTWSVRILIFFFLGVALATIVSDWYLLQSLVREVDPARATDPVFLLPLVLPVLFCVGGLKAYPLLRFKEVSERHAWERSFARLLPFALPVLLLCLAKRLAVFSQDPLEGLLAEQGSGSNLPLMMGVFLCQLASQAVVGVSALFSASRLATETRPSVTRVNPPHRSLKRQLDKSIKQFDRHRHILGRLEAMLATLEGERTEFLGRAEAMLCAELVERRAAERQVSAIRDRISRRITSS